VTHLDQQHSGRGGLFLRLHRSQAGEGVISAAIAVLVMAVIGAAMYFAFAGTFDTASDRVDEQVGRIGDG
jgi:uncharacterized membrane protein (DUF485 family)